MPTDPELKGITPRAVAEIFRLMEANKAVKEFTISVSMYELYRDGLIDLLQKVRVFMCVCVCTKLLEFRTVPIAQPFENKERLSLLLRQLFLFGCLVR